MAIEHLVPGASIVNVASIAAVRALPGRAAYTASKFGVVGLTQVLAVEWADRQVRVNAAGFVTGQTLYVDGGYTWSG